MKEKYKLCVIGTGIAGGALLSRLVELGMSSILVVEAGAVKESSSVSHITKGRDFKLRSTRAIQLGGTSNLWHGVLAPLDLIDFEKRSFIGNSGWPITYKHLLPFYKKAARFLGIENFKLFDSVDSQGDLNILKKDIKLDKSVFVNKFFQQPLPPVNTKNTFLKSLGDIELANNSVALELIKDSKGNVEKLKVGKLGGEIDYIYAEKFIVSCGALETPRLLINSGFENENIGRYLMDHPMGNLFQVDFKKKIKAPIYSDMKISKSVKMKSGVRLTESFQLKEEMPNHNFFFRPSFIRGIDNESEKLKMSLLAFKDGKFKIKDFFLLIKKINLIAQILIYKFSLNVKFRYADVFVVSEQSPCVDSYVALSDEFDEWGYPRAMVNWKVSDKDIESVEKLYEHVKNSLCDDIALVHEKSDIKWRGTLTSAAHHLGTCRMSNSANDGVVNSNLKVHGTNNLYVCDGSVFPTSGNVNSSLTIAALAFRLADYLVKK